MLKAKDGKVSDLRGEIERQIEFHKWEIVRLNDFLSLIDEYGNLDYGDISDPSPQKRGWETRRRNKAMPGEGTL